MLSVNFAFSVHCLSDDFCLQISACQNTKIYSDTTVFTEFSK